ncbi:MAG: glycerol-3-phosphate 1-O-acyltransferase PlsY [Thermomicrobiales bacterium]|nr:glycerol-3-phosphate 1-O-acyltransferase PlsY [Thermomicrobiales bacterium]
MMQMLVLVAAYLIGTLPTGYVLTRFLAGVDLRSVGSGGTGATNAQRALGTKWGIFVAIVDVLKGVAAVILARVAGLDDAWVAACGAAVIAGHCWPVWLRFRGGKGVATGAGAALTLSLWSIALVPVMVIPIALTRYVSLGSVLAALATPILMALLAATGVVSWSYVGFGVVAAAIIVYRHRANIDRLIHGTERKLGRKPADVRTVE